MIRLPSDLIGSANSTTPPGNTGGNIRLPSDLTGGGSAIATATPVKKPLLPPMKTSGGFAQTYNKGEGFGPSNIQDTTGKPLMVYENPKAQQTQLLADRTATTFDPSIPQKIDPKTLSNSDKRLASDSIRQALGATAKQQLDHIMPLELGGSNSDTFNDVNLRLEPTTKGVNTATDPIENQITKRVLNGDISLVQGWQEMAKAKGITLPENGGKLVPPQPNPPSFWDRLKTGAKNVASDVGNYFLGNKIQQPQNQTPIPQQSPMIRLGQEFTGMPTPSIPTSLPSVSDMINKAVPSSTIMQPAQMTPEQQAQKTAVENMTPIERWKATGTLAASIPQGIAQAALKFGVSAYQAPQTIISGGSIVPDAIPVPPLLQTALGEKEISSYQKDTATDIGNGVNPVYAVGVNSAKALFDAWLVSDIGGAVAKPVLKSIVNQLPEDVLYKISEEKIPVSEIMDVLRGTGTSERADAFIKSLADDQRRPLASLARESEKAGMSDITIRKTGEPTLTGELLGVEKKAPQAVIEAPTRALPGTQEVSPGPAVGLSTREVKHVGDAYPSAKTTISPTEEPISEKSLPLSGAAKTLTPAQLDEARAFGIEGSQTAEAKFEKDQRAVNAQNLPLFPTKKPSFWQRLREDLNPMKYQEAPVRDAWVQRNRDILFANEKANRAFQELETLPKGVSSMIRYQRGEMGQDWDYAERVKNVFDKLYQEGEDRGLKLNYQENYLPQVYANPSGEIVQALAKYMADNGVDPEIVKNYLAGKALPEEISKTLKLNPTFSRTKIFPDYGVAIEYGLTPRFEHPGQLAGYYVTEMEKALANKKFLDTLQDSGALSGVRRAGDKVLDIPYFSQDLYGKPRLIHALQNYFRDEEHLGLLELAIKGVATINRKLQELVLSGGVPGTNINFFTIGAGLIKDITAGELRVLGRFFKSNFDGATIRYFKENQDYIDRMAKEGINLGSRTGNWDRIYRQLSTKKGFGRGLEWFGDKFDWAFNKKTFQSFMPMQTVSLFKRTFDSAIKDGIGEAEAQKLAGDTTKAWMGLTDDWGRGRTVQDSINALFFAPKFRESLINLFINTGKSIVPKKFGGQWKNKAFNVNKKFFVGIIISYVLYNLLNKIFTGKYMFQNEPGKEFDLKIPYGNGKFVYVAWLPSILAFPRNMISGGIALSKFDLSTATQKFGSLFSMLIKATSEIISNKDHFGRAIYKDTDTAATKIGKIAAYLGLNYNHPYVQSVYEMTTQGGNEDLFQTLSRAFELPFKFGSQSSINSSAFYNAMNANKTPHARDVERIQPIYEKAQQLLQDGKSDDAQAMVDGLSASDYEIYKSIRTAAKAKATVKAEAQMADTVNRVRDLIAAGKQDEAQAIVDSMSDEDYRIYTMAKKRMGYE